MPKLNTTVKSVRIDNDKLEVLEQRLGNKSINAWLNEQIAGFVEGKPTEIPEKIEASPNKDLKEIESMASFFGVTTEDLLKGVCDGLTDGNLTIEKGKVVGVPDIELDRFKEVCHDVNQDPQEMLDKVTGLIEKGRI